MKFTGFFSFADIWFEAEADEASLKSYDGVAISLRTPKIPLDTSSSVNVSLKVILSSQLKLNNAIFTGTTLPYKKSK